MLGKLSRILTKADMKAKGEGGEEALNAWLKANKLSYLFIKQSPDTFATLFSGAVKRPDFLILFESIGLLAVDAKNYSLTRGEYTLGYETELKKVLAFERLFRIPVWYAYLGDDGGEPCWYERQHEVARMLIAKTSGKKVCLYRRSPGWFSNPNYAEVETFPPEPSMLSFFYKWSLVEEGISPSTGNSLCGPMRLTPLQARSVKEILNDNSPG